MATSGQVIYNLSAGDLVKQAFRKIGVNPAEQPLQPFEMQDGLTALNLMMKSWQAYNAHLWVTLQGVVFLNEAQASYALGPSGDNACLSDDFIASELTSAITIGAVILPVESTVGMTAGDYIGVEINNNIRQWSTIVSVDSATQLTIASGVSAACDSGNSIFTYTTKLNRPLRVPAVRRKYYAQSNEIALTEFSNQQYFDQVNKNQAGTPISWYYQPTLVNGLLYIWQPTSSVNQYLHFTFYSPLQTVVTQANTLSFPEEWQEGIIWNIAARLCTDYNVPADKKEEIKIEATAFFNNVIQFDEEMTSLNIQPDLGWG